LTEPSGTIPIDPTAAGHGWATIDLSVLRHEFGRALGYEHSDDGVMSETLAPGQVYDLSTLDGASASGDTEPQPAADFAADAETVLEDEPGTQPANEPTTQPSADPASDDTLGDAIDKPADVAGTPSVAPSEVSGDPETDTAPDMATMPDESVTDESTADSTAFSTAGRFGSVQRDLLPASVPDCDANAGGSALITLSVARGLASASGTVNGSRVGGSVGDSDFGANRWSGRRDRDRTADREGTCGDRRDDTADRLASWPPSEGSRIGVFHRSPQNTMVWTSCPARIAPAVTSVSRRTMKCCARAWISRSRRWSGQSEKSDVPPPARYAAVTTDVARSTVHTADARTCARRSIVSGSPVAAAAHTRPASS
jgi:hypothetical protein